MVLAVSMRGYEMNPRKESATVQLKVRLKEPLRARIEKAARKRKHPMNTEIVDRLEMSFSKDEKLQLTHQLVMDGVYEQFGEKGTYCLMKYLVEALGYVENETGKSWLNDKETYEQVHVAWTSILRRYGPERDQPTKPATDPTQLGEEIAGVLVNRFKGRQISALLEKRGNSKANSKTLEK